MELVETLEIDGEEREIADAYAREQCAANAEGIDGINSNLAQLEFGELSGNNNIFNGTLNSLFNMSESNGLYSNTGTDSRTSPSMAVYFMNGSTVVESGLCSENNGRYCFSKSVNGEFNILRIGHSGATNDEYAKFDIGTTSSGDYTVSVEVVGKNPSVVGGFSFKNIQLEKGLQATSYEPYIPSVKMLATENAQQNTEAMDLKMLGWTVPKECPVQNYVDSDGVFHQRIGRVDLGSLSWSYNSTYKMFNSSTPTDAVIQISGGINIFTNKYTRDRFAILYNNLSLDKRIFCNDLAYGSNTICVRDLSYTDATAFKTAMKGVYLYYELATEKTISVDGNEAVTKVNDSLGTLNLFGNAIIGKRWNGLVDANRAQFKIKVNPNETYTIKIFDNPNSFTLFGFQADNDSDGTSGIGGTDIGIENTLKITTKSNCKYLLLNIVSSSTMTSDMADSFKAMVVKGDTEPTEYYDFSGSNGVVAKDLADMNNAIDGLKSDLYEKLKVISVSLEGVMVSAMSSTTVDLPQEYIDAGYVIANILSKPDTGLSYTTGSETSIIIRNNTNSAVAFVPTTTVKVLIAKIG